MNLVIWMSGVIIGLGVWIVPSTFKMIYQDYIKEKDNE